MTKDRLTLVVGGLLLVVIGGGVLFWASAPISVGEASGDSRRVDIADESVRMTEREEIPEATPEFTSTSDGGTVIEEAEEDLSEDAKVPETAKEAAEREWNGILDRYYEKFQDGVKPTAAEVKEFKRRFDSFNAEEKAFHVVEAQNLISDSAIACLATILTDKSEPEEVLSSILCDLTNRPDEVKTPILKQLRADKEHPLHNDARELLSP